MTTIEGLAAADGTLHPDFGSRVWEAEGCAPLIVSGPKLNAVRQRVDTLAAGRRGARVGVPPGPRAGRAGGADGGLNADERRDIYSSC